MGTASTVVDGQDLFHVAVCHIASVVLYQPGDGLGMHCAQPENQPFPAIFALIKSFFYILEKIISDCKDVNFYRYKESFFTEMFGINW